MERAERTESGAHSIGRTTPLMRCVAVAGVLLFAAHFVDVLWHFPARHANPADPLASGDLSITLGMSWDVAGAGRLVGYSPSYMAGYPLGSWNSVGRRGYELATAYLPFGSPPANYRWAVVGMTVLSPILLALSGWAAGCRFATVLACLGGASLVVQLCDPVSYFWTFGNTGFVFGSAGAVLATGLALPRNGRVSLGRAAAAGLVAGIAVVMHTIAAVPVACGGLVAAIVCRRAAVTPSRIFIAVTVAIAVAAAVAGPMYYHLLSSIGQRSAMAIQPLPSGVKHLIMDLLNDRAYMHPTDRRTLFHVLIVLAAWAGWRDWRTQTGPAIGFALAGGLVLLFGYAAGQVQSLKDIQPYRFVVSGELFLAVPACLGLGRLAAMIRDANPAGRTAAVAVGFMFAPSLTGYVFDLPSRGLAGGLNTDSLACANWFRSAPLGGRVLCEPGGLGALFPHLTGRPVIGGAVGGQAVVAQNWAHAEGSRAFGKPLRDVTPAEFVRLLRALDVRFIVTESPEFDLYVRHLPADVAKEESFGPLAVYRLAPTKSQDVWEGVVAGKVAGGFNHIRVVDPPVGRIILPYHYVDGFRAEPGIVIEPETVPGAAAPFIAIRIPEQRAEVNLVFTP